MYRAAIYWVPADSDPLWDLGCAWLGRDPRSNAALPQPTFANLADITASPRRYGFHATLRPPMHLATSLAQLQSAVAKLAAAVPDFSLPDLQISIVDGFLALTLSAPCPHLHALSDAIILATDPHRAPPSAQEIARRRQAKLTAQEEIYLAAHGYPYVRDCWQFHMTLGRRLAPEQQTILLDAATCHFPAEILHYPRTAGAISLFVEPHPNTDLILTQDFPLQHT